MTRLLLKLDDLVVTFVARRIRGEAFVPAGDPRAQRLLGGRLTKVILAEMDRRRAELNAALETQKAEERTEMITMISREFFEDRPFTGPRQ